MVERVETGDGEVVADDVEVADGVLSRARGLMFRKEVSEGYALVFEFRREQRVVFHSVFVGFPFDIVFLDSDDVVVGKKTLRPWRGLAMEKAKRAVEMPEGAADELETGDRLELVD